MEKHNETVSLIAAQVKEFHELKLPFRIYHGTTSTTRPSGHRKENTIDICGLSNVLNVDTDRKVAVVEAGVSMAELVEHTLQHGLIPTVVMEFPNITVGGGFSGSSGESSSFKYGLFEASVMKIEIILGDGSILHASSTENSDLLYGASSSLGTLGIVTLLEVRLIEAKPYVTLEYCPVKDMGAMVQAFNAAIADPSNDFMDGLMYRKDQGVICIGRMTDIPSGEYPVQTFSNAKDPWFHHHAQNVIQDNSSQRTLETIPLREYLFRYDRGAFWAGDMALAAVPLLPINGFTRWLFDWWMRSGNLYHALHKSGLVRRHIIQDVAVPFERAQEMVDYIDGSLCCYPLWFCPVSLKETPSWGFWTNYADHRDMLLDIGVYTPFCKQRKEFVQANRNLEHKTSELLGYKVLYSENYYTEDEFWAIYPREQYYSLQKKYHADNLPSLYEKATGNLEVERKTQGSWGGRLAERFRDIRALAVTYGFFHTLFGREYVLRG